MKPEDRIEEINEFVFSENSMIQKAKRYDSDIRFLLGQLSDERRRHASCEEQMLVYSDPANISKVMRLELLDKVITLVNEAYNEPFYDSKKLEFFESYIEKELISQVTNDHSYASDKKLLGSILKLFIEHFNRPSAC